MPAAVSVVNHKLPSVAIAGANEICAGAVYVHFSANVEYVSAYILLSRDPMYSVPSPPMTGFA